MSIQHLSISSWYFYVDIFQSYKNDIFACDLPAQCFAVMTWDEVISPQLSAWSSTTTPPTPPTAPPSPRSPPTRPRCRPTPRPTPTPGVYKFSNFSSASGFTILPVFRLWEESETLTFCCHVNFSSSSSFILWLLTLRCCWHHGLSTIDVYKITFVAPWIP